MSKILISSLHLHTIHIFIDAHVQRSYHVTRLLYCVGIFLHSKEVINIALKNDHPIKKNSSKHSQGLHWFRESTPVISPLFMSAQQFHHVTTRFGSAKPFCAHHLTAAAFNKRRGKTEPRLTWNGLEMTEVEMINITKLCYCRCTYDMSYIYTTIIYQWYSGIATFEHHLQMNHLRNGRSLSWPLLHLDAANVQQQLHFLASCTQPLFWWFWMSIRFAGNCGTHTIYIYVYSMYTALSSPQFQLFSPMRFLIRTWSSTSILPISNFNAPSKFKPRPDLEVLQLTQRVQAKSKRDCNIVSLGEKIEIPNDSILQLPLPTHIFFLLLFGCY